MGSCSSRHIKLHLCKMNNSRDLCNIGLAVNNNVHLSI